MKNVFLSMVCMASLVIMTACGDSGGNKTATESAKTETKESNIPKIKMMEGVTQLQKETIEQIGRTTDTKVVLESSGTSFEEENYKVFDFNGCDADGTNTYLNHLFFLDTESYDKWITKEKTNMEKNSSYEIVLEDRDGLLIIYRHTLGYKMTYEEATKFGKLIN